MPNGWHLALLYTILYVGILYVHPKSRPHAQFQASDPEVIKIRFILIGLVSVICIWITTKYCAFGGLTASLEQLSIYPIRLPAIAYSLLLTAVLFLGPLVELLWIENEWKLVLHNMRHSMTTIQGWRNYFMGPLTEEVVFRAAVIPPLLFDGTSLVQTILLSPLLFGLAHVHHAYEFHLTHRNTPIVIVLLRSLFQLTYTTIFGWYAALIYLYFRSLWAAIIVHIFCNIMGFPRFWGRTLGGPNMSVLYYSVLVSGSIAFAFLLQHLLTHPVM